MATTTNKIFVKTVQVFNIICFYTAYYFNSFIITKTQFTILVEHIKYLKYVPINDPLRFSLRKRNSILEIFSGVLWCVCGYKTLSCY